MNIDRRQFFRLGGAACVAVPCAATGYGLTKVAEGTMKLCGSKSSKQKDRDALVSMVKDRAPVKPKQEKKAEDDSWAEEVSIASGLAGAGLGYASATAFQNFEYGLSDNAAFRLGLEATSDTFDRQQPLRPIDDREGEQGDYPHWDFASAMMGGSGDDWRYLPR